MRVLLVRDVTGTVLGDQVADLVQRLRALGDDDETIRTAVEAACDDPRASVLLDRAELDGDVVTLHEEDAVAVAEDGAAWLLDQGSAPAA